MRKVHKDFFDFIKGEFPKVLKWSGPSVTAEQVYKSALGSLGGSAPATTTTLAPAQPVPVKKEEAKKAAAKAPKEPVKILRYKTWEISHYGAETIEFKAEDV